MGETSGLSVDAFATCLRSGRENIYPRIEELNPLARHIGWF